MPRYVQTKLGQRIHLGRPHYDDDLETWVHPSTTLCGLVAETWSKAFVRLQQWANKKPGAVCDTCDRTAMWETIGQLSAR